MSTDTSDLPTDAKKQLLILVIDDSNTIRKTANIFLGNDKGPYRTLLANDGFEALSTALDHRPDLIFCDVMMPRLDGYQTCAILKRSRFTARTPVVMLSSKDGLFDKARGTMSGADAYLTKPFTKDQLLEVVRRFTETPPEEVELSI